MIQIFRKMIVFSELQMQGDKHVQVNGGLLNIINATFTNQNIEVFCDSRHEIELLNFINSSVKLHFNTFNYTGASELKKRATFSKTLRESLLAFRIFLFAKKKKAELVIFASAFPFTSVIINFFSWLFQQKTIICLHGDIGVLKLKNNKLTTNIFRIAIKLFFICKPSNVILLFYGKTIETNLFRIYPNFRKDKIISIDHPYNYNFTHNIISNENDKLIIANIGTGIINKNSQFLFQLANLLKKQVEGDCVEFLQIGNISKEVLAFSNPYVKIINKSVFLPIEDFELNLLRAHYFIYFFTPNSLYDLCPSGTFFDAIKYSRPIIAIRNPFFEYYFNKLGNIGYLCDSITDIFVIINNILNKKLSEYQIQVDNLLKAKEILSIENISLSFQEQYFNDEI